VKRVGVFLGAEPSGGGLFQYTESILDALRAAHGDGWSVDVAYVSTEWEAVLARFPFHAIRVEGGRRGLQLASLMLWARVPGPIARGLSAVNPVARALAARKCDLWIFPAQDALTYQVPVPVLGTIHDLMHRYEPSFPEVSQFGRRGIRDHRFRSMLAWARGVLVDSQVGRDHVVESYGADPARVHPLPYVPPSSMFRPEPAGFDDRYRLPAKFLFYPAQFWHHKNHKRLVSAAAAVAARRPDLALVFTGGKSHAFDDVNAHARAVGLADRITFAGYVPADDMPGFYRRARALVMPTFFGPTNIPPLEAFAAGCPVAVSNIYGMPEQMNGAALLFDPNSVDEIAGAIERLWTDDELCRTLAAAGRGVIERWGPPQFAARLRGILEAVA
jgi:glycosyltransferase involved in cell wall biosynthesis